MRWGGWGFGRKMMMYLLYVPRRGSWPQQCFYFTYTALFCLINGTYSAVMYVCIQEQKRPVYTSPHTAVPSTHNSLHQHSRYMKKTSLILWQNTNIKNVRLSVIYGEKCFSCQISENSHKIQKSPIKTSCPA